MQKPCPDPRTARSLGRSRIESGHDAGTCKYAALRPAPDSCRGIYTDPCIVGEDLSTIPRHMMELMPHRRKRGRAGRAGRAPVQGFGGGGGRYAAVIDMHRMDDIRLDSGDAGSSCFACSAVKTVVCMSLMSTEAPSAS